MPPPTPAALPSRVQRSRPSRGEFTANHEIAPPVLVAELSKNRVSVKETVELQVCMPAPTGEELPEKVQRLTCQLPLAPICKPPPSFAALFPLKTQSLT